MCHTEQTSDLLGDYCTTKVALNAVLAQVVTPVTVSDDDYDEVCANLFAVHAAYKSALITLVDVTAENAELREETLRLQREKLTADQFLQADPAGKAASFARVLRSRDSLLATAGDCEQALRQVQLHLRDEARAEFRFPGFQARVESAAFPREERSPALSFKFTEKYCSYCEGTELLVDDEPCGVCPNGTPGFTPITKAEFDRANELADDLSVGTQTPADE